MVLEINCYFTQCSTNGVENVITSTYKLVLLKLLSNLSKSLDDLI